MGENKKVTTMVLKVDLQCEKCYRKVKKILCKFPQIRDQTFDEKKNQVIIKVVCCNPEKFRDKLCCKGCGVIKSIDIIVPPPVKPPPPPETVKPPPPPETVKPPPPPETVKPPPPPPPCTCRPATCTCRPAPCTCRPAPCTCRPAPCTCRPAPCTCRPVQCTCRPAPCTCRPAPCACPPVPPPVKCPRPPVNTCCTDCCGWHPGGPCQTGYGYGGWSYNTRSYCVTRTDCFCEENPQACAIM